jgi:hypothetical protein
VCRPTAFRGLRILTVLRCLCSGPAQNYFFFTGTIPNYSGYALVLIPTVVPTWKNFGSAKFLEIFFFGNFYWKNVEIFFFGTEVYASYVFSYVVWLIVVWLSATARTRILGQVSCFGFWVISMSFWWIVEIIFSLDLYYSCLPSPTTPDYSVLFLPPVKPPGSVYNLCV